MQLLLLLLFVLFLGKSLPPAVIQLLYSISLILKECLSFLLPFMVFAFISSGILAFKKRAPLVILVLLTCIMLSNSLTAFFAYLVSMDEGKLYGSVTSTTEGWTGHIRMGPAPIDGKLFKTQAAARKLVEQEVQKRMKAWK